MTVSSGHPAAPATARTPGGVAAGPVDVEDVRRRHPIEEVVAASGVQLHPAGRGWMGCCPFHEDTTASLSVAGIPDRFHCFGCGASGDVIDYVGRLHGVGFREAVTVLDHVLDHTPARRMPLGSLPRAPAPALSPDPSVGAVIDPGRGYEINAMAWRWFSQPVAHAFAVSYLRNLRSIDLRPAELDLGHDLVGHTDHGWTTLVDHLRGRGVTDDELVAMGLAQTSRQGRLIDTLHDRLILEAENETTWIGRLFQERRLDAQVVVGLLVDRTGFPMKIGGFNRLSQHLLAGVCGGTTSRVVCGGDGQGVGAFAGPGTRSGTLVYRPSKAQWHAQRRAARPKTWKLAANDRLRGYV